MLVVEHELRERARELGLADARRAEEEERADRPVRILEAGAGAAHGVGDGLDRLVLADHALAQPLLHVDELLRLALQQPATGMPVQRGDDEAMSSSLTSSFTIGSRRRASRSASSFSSAGMLAVADLGGALELALALGALGLHLQLVDAAW